MKQEFAPTSCTNPPATLGATISDPCCACDINPFTAISPAIGTSVRTATDCAGTKNAETTLIVNRMTYITYRSCTNTSARTSTPRIRSLAIIVRFKCHRSTKTPASGLTIASGAINETSTIATCVAVPCRLNVTTAMIANTARKSPNTLTICAIHRRRTGRSRNTSLKDRGVPGVDIRVRIPFPKAMVDDVDSRELDVRSFLALGRLIKSVQEFEHRLPFHGVHFP